MEIMMTVWEWASVFQKIAARMKSFALFLVYLTCASAIRFTVKPLDTKCLSENVEAGELIVGSFAFTYGDTDSPNTDIEVKVFGPLADTMHSRRAADSGKFALTSGNAGDHQFCFANAGQSEITVMFKLDIGLAAKDYSAVAKKENLKPLELELRRLEDLVVSIHDNMEYMKTREEAMRNTNGRTCDFALFVVDAF
jgi:hypothetical protein